jgi:hypothetical protein
MQARLPGTAVLVHRSPLDPAVGTFRAELAPPGTAPAPTPAVTRDRRPLVRLIINWVLSTLLMVVLARVLLTLARRPPGQLR